MQMPQWPGTRKVTGDNDWCTTSDSTVLNVVIKRGKGGNGLNLEDLSIAMFTGG